MDQGVIMKDVNEMVSNRKPKQSVEEIEREIIQRIGSLSKSIGLGELTGLLAGTLVLHMGEPVSLEFLTETTRYSKSSVSTLMRTLMGFGFFDSVKIEGDRRRYYMFKDSFIDVFLQAMEAIVNYEIKPMLTLLDEYIPTLEELAKSASVKAERERASKLLQRVLKVKKEYESFFKFLMYLDECAQNYPEKSK